MNIVAIIPAKENSTGVPGKNYRKLLGRSLVERAIDSAQVKEIDGIFVSTDSSRILTQISANSWEKSPEFLYRPLELTLDSAQVDDVILFSLRQLERRYGKPPNTVIVLQPTSPFRTAKDVGNAMERYKRYEGETMITLVSGYWPNKYFYGGDGLLAHPLYHDPLFRMGRQDTGFQERVFMENGAIYISESKHIMRFKTCRSREILPFAMEEWKSIDIDNQIDWDIAEEIGNKYENNS